MVDELLFCWDREGQRGHASFLLLCWGRREGWRNNLDGLGLIKEKERNTHKKKAHIVRLRALGWAAYARYLQMGKPDLQHCTSLVVNYPTLDLPYQQLQLGILTQIHQQTLRFL